MKTLALAIFFIFGLAGCDKQGYKQNRPLFTTFENTPNKYVVTGTPVDLTSGLKIVEIAIFGRSAMPYSDHVAIFFPDKVTVSVGKVVNVKWFTLKGGATGSQPVGFITTVEK